MRHFRCSRQARTARADSNGANSDSRLEVHYVTIRLCRATGHHAEGEAEAEVEASDDAQVEPVEKTEAKPAGEDTDKSADA